MRTERKRGWRPLHAARKEREKRARAKTEQTPPPPPPPPPEPPPAPTKAAFKTKAQGHALELLDSLASLAKGAASEAVRVSAANAVLDRAYGRPVSGTRAGADEDGEGCGRVVEVRWSDPNWP